MLSLSFLVPTVYLLPSTGYYLASRLINKSLILYVVRFGVSCCTVSPQLWRIEDTTEMVLDEKRDGLVDENRITNEQKEKQQKVYTPKNRSVDLICFKQ